MFGGGQISVGEHMSGHTVIGGPVISSAVLRMYRGPVVDICHRLEPILRTARGLTDGILAIRTGGRGLKPRSQHTKWTDLKSRPIVYAA